MLSKDESSEQPFLDDDSGPVAWRETKSPPVFNIKQALLLVGTAVFSIATTIAISLAIFPHTSYYTPPSALTVPGQILECGTSASEARALGCEFDIMHYSWTPAPCFNRTLSEEYWNGLVSNGIEFWSDYHKNGVLPYDEILAAKHEFAYTSWVLHLKHCQYLIHRQLQTLASGGPVDNLSRNISHSVHCLGEIRTPPDVKTMILTGTGYMKCAYGAGDIGPVYSNAFMEKVESR